MGLVMHLLLLIFNGILLALPGVSIMVSFDWNPLRSLEWLITSPLGLWGVGILGGVMIVFISGWLMTTGVGEYLLRRRFHLQRLSKAQTEQLIPVSAVAKAIHFNGPLPHVFVAQGSIPVAACVGRQTIIVHPQFLELPYDAQAGVLAHELAHLKQGHTRQLAFSMGCNWVGRLSANICLWLVHILGVVAGIFTFGVGTFLVRPLQWALKGIYRIVMGIYNLIFALTSQHHEYYCDEIAAKAGLGHGLIQVLSALGDLQQGQNMIDRIYASHPPVTKRIQRLQKLV